MYATFFPTTFLGRGGGTVDILFSQEIYMLKLHLFSLVPRPPQSGNTNIEVVQAWRAWYFSHMSTVKDRKTLIMCVGIPEDSEHEKEQGNGPLTACI